LAALHLAAGTMSRRQHYKNTRQRFYNTTHISRTTINLPCIICRRRHIKLQGRVTSEEENSIG
jgi:hypothetical protein